MRKFYESEFSAHVYMQLHKNGMLIKIMECDMNINEIKYKDAGGMDYIIFLQIKIFLEVMLIISLL